MGYRFRISVVLLTACVTFPERSPAPVIFQPGDKAKYEAPGEMEISCNANDLFAQAGAAANSGDPKGAIKIYRHLVKKYPHSNVAPEATYRAAVLAEQMGDLHHAAGIYRGLMENYPQSQHFQEAIESQFRIGESLLTGKKKKILGVPVGSTVDEAVEIFAAIVRSAPYGRYTARAQFDIGRAREKEDAPDLAVDAYQSVVEKFPNDPLAVDAQYQIGYIWFTASRSGINDPAAAEKARVAFQDFLFRFPKSEKAPQARENLAALEHHKVKSSLNIAKYYDKAKNYRAAVLYYNEVLKQQPNSTESDYAKKRIAQLRAKVGDAALQSAAEIAERKANANPAKTVAHAPGSSSAPGGTQQKSPASPAMRANPNDIAPLPPPADADSLPPPANEGSAPADSSGAPAPSPTPSPAQ